MTAPNSVAEPNTVLVVNAGSSSLKVRLLAGEDVVDSLDLTDWSGAEDTDGLERFVTAQSTVDVVGHRIVHGGARFTEPVVLDSGVRDAIAALTELAPLHQPRGVAGIDAVWKVLPDTPAVACFDTAFHTTLPAAAATYALPREWNERWALRRHGFHGLSHSHAARRTAELLGRPLRDLRIVTCHLGAGASLAAVDGGRSVDTTMGFTPLAGLVMATRSGSVDPGLVLWLLEHSGLDLGALTHALESESGLLGLGGSADMREILRRADTGDPAATLAFDVYVHRLVREIAAMTASLRGLDALTFTGGVGEHSPRVRAAATAALAHLGVHVDDSRNTATSDADISTADAEVRTLVVTAREDLEIARHTRTALS
ncbi:Acetate kinase [Actinokineospora spheciospongiae]|uniref:Acetate kinase n=1 Tax=Actinokineospora spheciospongiae TaxID=909613 RepID=W7IQS3_9PSEU|nr:acetate/propionate family kinase [Actinokineospora spheciospongiae]EWC63220.1 Acetate kinase [Actinokineospora spheciospongiae]PWW66948.1 acetate kinase [Actinokineospora spheciospongiae]